MYEERLLAYVDILGWKTACTSSDLDPVAAAVKVIHRHWNNYSEQRRQELAAGSTISPNPMFMSVQFAAFSDHFVFSKPADFGGRIFSVGKICLDLLQLGFLTRGAIVLGDLYHCDNQIFGPALIEAVRIEETEAIFPRVIVTDAVIRHCERLGHLGNHRQDFIIEDHLGRSVLNLFSMPEYGQNSDIDRSIIRENIPLQRIRRTVDAAIRRHNRPEQAKFREKWVYLESMIEERIFKIYPLLREAIT